MTEFAIKDSGQRQEFGGGMVRDTTEGKIDWLNLRFGPLYRRIAEHLTKGRIKYPDPEPGVPNWTLAEGREEALRAKQSAARHFEQWLQGDLDEDHASAVAFNMNLFEYIREKDPSIPAGFGTGAALREEELLDWEVVKAELDELRISNEPASRPWTITEGYVAPGEVGFTVVVPTEPCNGHCLDCDLDACDGVRAPGGPAPCS